MNEKRWTKQDLGELTFTGPFDKIGKFKLFTWYGVVGYARVPEMLVEPDGSYWYRDRDGDWAIWVEDEESGEMRKVYRDDK